MNLQDINKFHANQVNDLFNLITKRDNKEYKPSYQDEDDLANYNNQQKDEK